VCGSHLFPFIKILAAASVQRERVFQLVSDNFRRLSLFFIFIFPVIACPYLEAGFIAE
jgi:hypothetical protein